MAQQSSLVVAFATALTELVTVEKKNIVVLTEIARDALQTEPQSAPSLAALITNRILQVPSGSDDRGESGARRRLSDLPPPAPLSSAHAHRPPLLPALAGAAAAEASRAVPAGQRVQAGGRALQDAVCARAARGE